MEWYTYIHTLKHYFIKLSGTFKLLIKTPEGIAMLIPVIAAPELTTEVKALWLLAGLFVGDFITGVGASYVEFKKSIPVLPGSGKRYVIQSSKLRMTVVKFCAYGFAALIAKGIQWAFISREFTPVESLNTMSFTTIVIAFCCLIEAYSIVFENIKRMGFDVIQVIKNASGKGWDLYNTVKNDKKDEV